MIKQAISTTILVVGTAILFASLCSFVHAQEAAKTFSLTVTSQDLQVMSAGLDELPRKVSQPLVERLQRQLVPQMAPAQAPAAEPKAEEKK